MEIGDYVRTKSGYISKYIGKNKTPYVEGKHLSFETTIRDIRFEETDEDTMIWESELEKGLEEIIKSSPNIIDLLEVGDLVKIEYYSPRYEERVERLFETTYKDKEHLNLENSKCDFMLINKEFTKHDKALEPVIKSIITKEQIEQMEYKL